MTSPNETTRHNARRAQRQAMACTECARRKQRCSKTIPCTSCVDRAIADSCRREVAAAVPQSRSRHPSRPTRYSAAEAGGNWQSVSGQDSSQQAFNNSNEQQRSLTSEAHPDANVLDTLGDIGVRLGVSNRPRSVNSPRTQEKRLGLMNETVVTLEFLTHGRRNILDPHNEANIEEATVETSMNTLSSPELGTNPNTDASNLSWDAVLAVDECRKLLAFHGENLSWMHNVVHTPTLIREFELSLTRPPSQCWIALYYAVLSTTMYHIREDQLNDQGIECTETIRSAKALHDRSVQCLYNGNFTSKHSVHSVQAICVLLQVSHNFDQSDMISVLVAAAIKICQCLNIHRLGPDRSELIEDMETNVIFQFLVDREVKKRVWWFLVRQDWLQIPFQNTYLVHASQFNTPMPTNCFDIPEMMVRDNEVVSQPHHVYTQNSYSHSLNLVAVIIWKHQDRMIQVGHPGTSSDGILKLYEQVLWANKELDHVFMTLPEFLQATPKLTHSPYPEFVKRQASVVLISMAHKILTVHRHFQLESFRDRRFAYTQMSCLAIAERSILDMQSWTDSPVGHTARRMWTVITHLITCSVIVLFASMFRFENALLYDGSKMRHLAETGRRIIGLAEPASSIARRGSRMLDALLDLDERLRISSDARFDMEKIIRSVSDMDEFKHNDELFQETTQFTLPWMTDNWNHVFGNDDLNLDIL